MENEIIEILSLRDEGQHEIKSRKDLKAIEIISIDIIEGERKNLTIKMVQEFGEGLPEHRTRSPKEIDSPQTVEISNCDNETDQLSRIYFICCECNGVKTNHFEVIIKYILI
jgi:hypothetical protein